jgi:hypothetical protein
VKVPTPVTDLHKTPHDRPGKEEQVVSSDADQDADIVDLADQGGYDSEGQSVAGDTIPLSTSKGTPGRIIIQNVSQQALPRDTTLSTWSVSPGAVSRTSDFESESRFLRLKRQRENVFSRIASSVGFTRANPGKDGFAGSFGSHARLRTGTP